MKHVFEMIISPYTGTASIRLNGQTTSSQSQLRVCALGHVSQWYRDLPDLLYSEVNDEYALKIECLEIEYAMIMAILAGRSECLNVEYHAISQKYDTKTRLQWMNEAAIKAGVSVPLISGFSIVSTADAFGYRASIQNELDDFVKRFCTNHAEQVTVVIATKASYSEGRNMGSSDNDIILVVDETATGMSVEVGNCLAISTTKKHIVSLIQQWIDITILYPYMIFCHSKITNSSKANLFYVKARLQMLIQDNPVVESKMPDRLECGNSSAILLEEFPLSNLIIKSNNPSVVKVHNDRITAVKAGMTTLEVISETGSTLCVHNITVYFVPRVTSIKLSVVNGSTVLEGEQFVVNATCTPGNATNISNSRWSIAPAGSARVIGGGKFEALKGGTCTITLEIDGVTQSISVQVMPLAKGIKMSHEIKMKVNAAPTAFHAGLEPVGSACKTMNVRIMDTSVAQWNPASKSIVAMNEGDTLLEVSAIDAKGNTIVRQTCKVTILPEKDIITPPTYPTIIIVCAILAAITVKTPMSPIAALCGCIASGITLVQNLGLVIKKNGTTQNKLECVIGTAGAIGCLLVILFYFGVI